MVIRPQGILVKSGSGHLNAAYLWSFELDYIDVGYY